MRVGAAAYVPMPRRSPVAAGGGVAAAPAPAVTAAPAAPVTAASAPATGGTLQTMTMKVTSFFSNLWDTFLGPMLKSVFGGLFGARS